MRNIVVQIYPNAVTIQNRVLLRTLLRDITRMFTLIKSQIWRSL